jgi:hypothetical protein
MEGTDIKKLVFMWLAVPLTALDWWFAWDRLPARVVMKTGLDGRPRAWADRGDAMMLELKILAGILLFCSVMGYVVAGAGSKAVTVTVIAGWGAFFLLNWVLWSKMVP